MLTGFAVHNARFPKIGTNVEEGMVGEWHKAEGDTVAEGDALVELITDKATFDLEAEATGVLRKILAPTKSHVPVDYILALIGAEDESLPDVAAENERLMSVYRARAGAADWGHSKRNAPKAAPKRIRATPAARRLARQKGIDLSAVRPSGGRQVISEVDVQAHTQEQRPEPGDRRPAGRGRNKA